MQPNVKLEIILLDRSGSNTQFICVQDTKENFLKVFLDDKKKITREDVKQKIEQIIAESAKPHYPDFGEVLDFSLWKGDKNLIPYKGFEILDEDDNYVDELKGEEWFEFHCQTYFAKNGTPEKLRSKVKSISFAGFQTNSHQPNCL